MSETPKEQGGKREANRVAREALLKQLESIPKGVYVEMASVPKSTIDKHARQTGLPVLGATVNLFSVVSWIHHQVKANRAAWSETEAAIDEGRREDARIKRIRRQQLEDELIPRDQVRAVNDRLAHHLRGYGEWLTKRDEKDILAKWNKMLDAFEREMKDLKNNQKEDC